MLHYCVANIAGFFADSFTQRLANATIAYVKKIADMGWQHASLQDAAIYSGVNVAGGFVTEQAVAKVHQMEYHELKSIIDNCPEFGGMYDKTT